MKIGRLQLNRRIGAPIKLGRLQLNRRIGAPATNWRDVGHPQQKMPQFVFYCFIHEAAAVRPPRSTTMAYSTGQHSGPAARRRSASQWTNGAPLRPSMPTVTARICGRPPSLPRRCHEAGARGELVVDPAKHGAREHNTGTRAIGTRQP
jgi:hypothetical protein